MKKGDIVKITTEFRVDEVRSWGQVLLCTTDQKLSFEDYVISEEDLELVNP